VGSDALSHIFGTHAKRKSSDGCARDTVQTLVPKTNFKQIIALSSATGRRVIKMQTETLQQGD
jgi:hypothetical protein